MGAVLHRGKRSAGIDSLTVAPLFVERRVEVQHGHEGLNALQRCYGIGILDRRTDDHGVVVGKVLHDERLVGLDGSQLVVVVVAEGAVAQVGVE